MSTTLEVVVCCDRQNQASALGLLIDPKVQRGNFKCDFKNPRGEKFSPGLIVPPEQKESLGDNQRQVVLPLSFAELSSRTKEIVNKIVFPSSIILLSHPQSVLIKWLPMLPLRGVISDCASEILFYLPIKPRPLWVIPTRNKGHQDEVSYFHLNARARASLN